LETYEGLINYLLHLFFPYTTAMVNRALILLNLFIQTLALYKSFTYLLIKLSTISTIITIVIITIRSLIGNRIRAFDWYQNQRPWLTLNVAQGS